jgi:N-acetyl sugar amidotransferase
MDSSDPEISIDAEGVCNHCHSAEAAMREVLDRNGSRSLDAIVARVKATRSGNHDCVIGLSGGVDSSYMAYQAVRLGLRPLVVHLDNGWNSELATENIHRIVSRLGLELETHVIDWPEFRAIQNAYLAASVVDVEVPTDHAITAIVYRTALREGLRFVLTGSNLATEAVMPASWNYAKTDLRNLRAIARRGGVTRFKSFPTASTLRLLYWQVLRRVRTIDLLNYLPYRRADAISLLQAEFGWRDYGLKHGESTFTRFYQHHILPQEFGIDKRKAHASSLICSGQLSRSDALAELDEPLYSSSRDLEEDLIFVTKKLGMTRQRFDELMSDEPRAHTEFANERAYADPIVRLVYRLRAKQLSRR